MDRLDSQYIRASVNPSDRYVMSVPGSSAFRPRTEETNLANLLVTGDWLTTGIQGGCAEGAVMAGLQTARAICGSPERIHGDPTKPLPAPLLARLPIPCAERPRYIERGGEVVLRGPFQQQGTRMYVFFLPADLAKLGELCDRFLNLGETRYRPLGPFVALGCADISQIRSLHPEDAKKGFMSERDVAFWVPVVAGDEAMGVFVPSRVAWFLPYIFVDSPAPMAVGREIYGFPKLAGRIDFAEPEGKSAIVSVDALAADRWSPTTRIREHRILDVRRKADDDMGALAALWNGLERAASGFSAGFLDAAQAIFAEAGTEAIASSLREISAAQSVRMAFLKQFRDTGDPNRACHRSIVEAQLRVTGFRSGGPLAGPFEVRIARLDSHPIVSDLGLSGDRIEPVFSAWFDFDFDIDVGQSMP